MEPKSGNDDPTNVDTPKETSNETPKDAPKESKELEEKNRQLFERAKKAETEAKELRAKMKEISEPEKPKSEQTPPPQSNEPDYARLAFLNSQNVTHPDDQKVVADEAERLKLPLTDVLGMQHIKAQLETNQATRTAQAGMPSGSGRSGGPAVKDAEFYAKNPDEPLPTDDMELAEKAINLRIKKEQSKGMFSEELYSG